MNVRLDQSLPRRRIEAIGATYSLEEFCKLHNLNLWKAKLIMTNELKLPVVTDKVMLSAYHRLFR